MLKYTSSFKILCKRHYIFYIKPYSNAKAVKKNPDPFLPEKKGIPRKKVLVFMQDLDELRSIRNFLEARDVETVCAVELEMAKGLAFQEKYGCIVVEFKMIEHAYAGWIEMIKGKDAGATHQNVIILLEGRDKERAEDILAAGADLCVIHPGDENLFLRDIHESILAFSRGISERESLAETDMEQRHSREPEGQQDLMDQIARMSSKLEDALILETHLRQELEEANKTKDELLSFAAHDLRSPLGTIWSTVEFILNPKMEIGPLNKEQIGFLTSIQKQTNNLLHLVDELLDWSRIRSGFVELNLSSLDFRVLIIEKCVNNAVAAGKKSIYLRHEIEGGLPFVSADENKIGSVLDNLIGNAVKYCSAGNKVTVRGKALGDEIVVEVEDTGPGLREDDLKKVFGAFQKLSPRPTAGEPSTGLGLSIVKKIVEAHGGRVGVRSEPGKGSVFYFALKK